MKRFLSLLVALVMVLSLVQLPAFAASEGTDYVIDGNIIRILTQDGWDEYFETANVAGNTVYLETDISIRATGLYVNCDLIGRKGGVENAAPDVTLKTLPMFSDMSENASASYLNLRPVEGKAYEFTSSYQGVFVKEIKSKNVTVSHITNYIDASNSGSSIGMIGAANNGATLTISDCVNYGNLTATGSPSFGGGILAAARNAADVIVIEDCANYGTISAMAGTGGMYGSSYSQNNITVRGCVNEGNIVAGSDTSIYAGGIVGSSRGTITVSDCVNKGTISGYRHVGGIVGGFTDATKCTELTITDSVNTGDVIAIDRNAGGIVGLHNNVTTISKCANYGDISTTGEGSLCAGGIAGVIRGSIDQSYNAGNITSSANVGGLTGNRYSADIANTSVSITNSYNEGAVTATNNYAAGIIYIAGYDTSENASNKISSVYNIGELSSSNDRNEHPITRRMIKGVNGSAILENAYAFDVKSVELYVGSDKSEDTMTTSLLTPNTEAGFERLPEGFSPEIWVACEGGYPILKNNLPKNADGTDKEYAVVTLTNGENGEAIKDAVTYVEKSGNYTVTLAPVTGYVVDTVTADGEEVEGAVNTYVVENVSDDIEVVVSYTTAPASEGVTNANRLFVATDDAYSLYAFGKYNVVEGNEAVDFGILVSFEAIDTEDFVITNEDVRKFSACIGEAAMGATEDGEYGVKLFGTMITEDGVYYCLPYAQYADGTVYYGTVMTVVND